MSERVLNLRDFRGQSLPPDVVRIDRHTQWGNPYVVGWNRRGFIVRVAARRLGRHVEPGASSGGARHTGEGVAPLQLTRSEAIMCFRADLVAILAIQPDYLEPLRGKRLACWCAPLACHGDVIAKLIP